LETLVPGVGVVGGRGVDSEPPAGKEEEAGHNSGNLVPLLRQIDVVAAFAGQDFQNTRHIYLFFKSENGR